MGLSRRRRALRALASGLAVAAGLILVVLWAGAANAEEPTTGSITIEHNTIYSEEQDFEFLGCSGSGCAPFILDDDTGTEDGGDYPDQVTGTDLAPGTYTISQPTAVPNWTLTSIVCDTGETVDLANRQVSIALTAGEDVRCVFTTQTQEITIQQDTVPDGPEDFGFTGCLGTGCSTFTLDDDTDPTLRRFGGASGLAPGTYVITQTAGPPLALTSITCNNSGENINLAGRRVTITLTANEHQTCKFTNRAPSITIEQDTAPNAAQDFSFTGCQGVGCSAFDLDDDADPTLARSVIGRNIAPGTYVITQAPSADWPLTALSCTTGESTNLANRQVTITLGATEQTTCTFTNTSATLTLVENTDPDSPQDFTFDRCLGDDCTKVVLDDDFDDTRANSTGKVPLPAGTYVVTADSVDGHELTSITCTTGEVVDLDDRRVTITLAASEQQSCTFTHRPPPPHLTDVAQISAGRSVTCVRLNDGHARCWGESSDSGVVGDGTFNDVAVPVEVLLPDGSGPLADVASVSTGFGHTCAALTNGQARCWGYGGDAILGNGLTATQPLPVVVSNPAGTGPLTDVADVGAGGNFSCALLSTGEVRCWGNNTAGQLGDGTTTVRVRPVVVSNSAGTGPLTGVTQLAVGGTRACALLASGEAQCWGSNLNGGLGDGTTTDRSRPVSVTNEAGSAPLTGVTQITSGWSQTCALLGSGEARCWGKNTNGQLGDGTTTHSSKPVVVSNPDGSGPLTEVVQVSAMEYQTCALVESGGVRCWGSNLAGAVGDGTTTDRLRPTPVLDIAGTGTLGDVVQVSAGFSHTCAVVTDGEARCWGGAPGGLGDGTLLRRLRPVPVIDPTAGMVPLTGAAETTAGGAHSCARLEDGGARCWGVNGSGQLGNAEVAASAVPVTVSNAAGDGPIGGVTDISAGQSHTCAVVAGGTPMCWGDNSGHLLGDGTTTSRAKPVAVLDPSGAGPLTGVIQISAGETHTCAVLSDTTARCWGANNDSQLGDGTADLRTLPVVVTNETGTGPLEGVKEISAGEDRTCAVLTTGEARCWGHGGLGNGGGSNATSARPVVVANPEGTGPLTGVSHVTIGSTQSCASLTTGQARCWGALPVAVVNTAGSGPLVGVVSIDADGSRTCTVQDDDTAMCWGDLAIGDGTLAARAHPTPVSGVYAGAPLAGVRQISTGDLHSCVTLVDGQARCWGRNDSGMVGDGTFLSTAPSNVYFRLRPRVVVVAPTP